MPQLSQALSNESAPSARDVVCEVRGLCIVCLEPVPDGKRDVFCSSCRRYHDDYMSGWAVDEAIDNRLRKEGHL